MTKNNNNDDGIDDNDDAHNNVNMIIIVIIYDIIFIIIIIFAVKSPIKWVLPWLSLLPSTVPWVQQTCGVLMMTHIQGLTYSISQEICTWFALYCGLVFLSLVYPYVSGLLHCLNASEATLKYMVRYMISFPLRMMI